MDKITAGVCIVGITATLQTVAWLLGKDGQVFALTSLVIGGIAGAIFGFSYRKTQEAKEAFKKTLK